MLFAILLIIALATTVIAIIKVLSPITSSMSFVGAVFISAIVLIAGMFVCYAYTNDIKSNITLESVTDIEPIKLTQTNDSKNIYVLTNGDNCYQFESKNGTIKINKDKCTINYTDKNARIEKYTDKPNEDNINYWLYVPYFRNNLESYQIYLPKNVH